MPYGIVCFHVLKQMRFCLEIVSVIYNRFKKDYCVTLFCSFLFFKLKIRWQSKKPQIPPHKTSGIKRRANFEGRWVFIVRHSDEECRAINKVGRFTKPSTFSSDNKSSGAIREDFLKRILVDLFRFGCVA